MQRCIVLPSWQGVAWDSLRGSLFSLAVHKRLLCTMQRRHSYEEIRSWAISACPLSGIHFPLAVIISTLHSSCQRSSFSPANYFQTKSHCEYKFIKFLLGPLIYFLKDPANNSSVLYDHEMKCFVCSILVRRLARTPKIPLSAGQAWSYSLPYLTRRLQGTVRGLTSKFRPPPKESVLADPFVWRPERWVRDTL